MEVRILRKELEFPQIDKDKIAVVGELIDAILDKETGEYQKELDELNRITGKEHDVVEFAEYWGWTSLEMISRQLLLPDPPCVRDLTKEDLAEVVRISLDSLIKGEDADLEYYVALLKRSLPLSDVMKYLLGGGSTEEIAERMFKAAKEEVICL